MGHHGFRPPPGPSGRSIHSQIRLADLMSAGGDRADEGYQWLPSVRLAPRDDLANLARVAPLLRAARDLDEWAATIGELNAQVELDPQVAALAPSARSSPPGGWS